jgi:oxygen-dependent protoporphyrinogen oxidase
VKKKIAILGAGISGLSTAYFLEKYSAGNITTEIFEASNSVGGSLKTVYEKDFTFECGPHTLRRGEEIRALDKLCIQLDLEKEKEILPNSLDKYVQYQGKIHPLPSSLKQVLFSPLFQGLKKQMIQGLLKKPARSTFSIGDFFLERLGEEFVERLLDPFCRGIWAASPYELSLKMCFPALFYKKDRRLFSHLFYKAPLRSSYIYSFKGGLSTLPNLLKEHVKGKIRLLTPVLHIRQQGEKIELATKEKKELFDLVISTLPSFALAPLLAEALYEEKKQLLHLLYKSVRLVHLGWHEKQLTYKGFGFLAPSREEKELLGAIWTSSLFPKRTPQGKGTSLAYLFEEKEASNALEDAKRHASKQLKISFSPSVEATFLAEKAIFCPSPHYEKEIDSLRCSLHAKMPQLVLAGTFLSGVSIYDCVDYAERVAIDIAKKNQGTLT